MDCFWNLRRNYQEVVVENTLKRAHKASHKHVEEEVASQDDPRRGGRNGPRKHEPCDNAHQKILHHGHSLVENVDLVAEHPLEKRQPHMRRLHPPHGQIHGEEGDHHERPSGVAAGKRTVIHLGGDEMRMAVGRPPPAHTVLDQGHDDKIHDECAEQVEEKHANLRVKLPLGQQVCGGRCWNQKHAVTGKLQDAQEHVEEQLQALLVHPPREIPVVVYNAIQPPPLSTQRRTHRSAF